VIAAADTFRAASIEQIKEHAEKIGVKVISNEYGSDPASVAFDAVKYAKKNSIDCVLVDTAGRMHTAKNLLKEMEKISKVCKPDLKIFVGESITGNDAIEQVKSFNWAIGIDGIVLTKADIDEKGGTALSVGYVTKKPILYLGTGQTYNSIEPFNKQKFIEKLGL
jgi:fused signal recognition particle receptor